MEMHSDHFCDFEMLWPTQLWKWCLSEGEEWFCYLECHCSDLHSSGIFHRFSLLCCKLKKSLRVVCVVRQPWLRPEPTWPPPLWTSSHLSLRWWHRSHWWRQSDQRWDTLSRWGYLLKKTQNNLNLVSVITDNYLPLMADKDKITNSFTFLYFRKGVFYKQFMHTWGLERFNGWLIIGRWIFMALKRLTVLNFITSSLLSNCGTCMASHNRFVFFSIWKNNVYAIRDDMWSPQAQQFWAWQQHCICCCCCFLLCVYWLLAKQR